MIFVDTSFFIALLDPQDKNHSRAVHAVEEFKGQRLSDQLLTTNNVVLETITVARYEVGHALAVRADQMLYDEKLARPSSKPPSQGLRGSVYSETPHGVSDDSLLSPSEHEVLRNKNDAGRLRGRHRSGRHVAALVLSVRATVCR